MLFYSLFHWFPLIFILLSLGFICSYLIIVLEWEARLLTWDPSPVNVAFPAIKFPLSTALAALWFSVSSLHSFNFLIFFVFLFVCLTHWLFRIMLFSFHIFVSFPNFFQQNNSLFLICFNYSWRTCFVLFLTLWIYWHLVYGLVCGLCWRTCHTRVTKCTLRCRGVGCSTNVC